MGELLLKVKAGLPHGQWTDWVERNLTVSLRQSQRYIAVAQGKVVPVRQLAGKSDTVSLLPANQKPNLIRCQGAWVNGRWRPKPGFFYLFKEGGANYWAHPSTRDDRWFHVCKHYDGPRMPTEGFSRRYTVFSPITDPAFTSEQYVGTTTPLGWIGVGDVLKSHSMPRTPQSDAVFANPKTGKPYVSFWASWNTARTLAGLEDVRVHDLRHSFASLLINSGRTLYEVQRLLGHTQIKTTQRYAHLAPETLLAASNAATQAVGSVMGVIPASVADAPLVAVGG